MPYLDPFEDPRRRQTLPINQVDLQQDPMGASSIPSFSFNPAFTNSLTSYDPGQAMRSNEDETRIALAQGLGIIPYSADSPPLPSDRQGIIDQRVAKIKNALGPGPLEQQYLQQVNEAFASKPVHGIRARLAGFGKGLLMGEGLPGAIRGAADPTTTNLRYRLSQLAPLFSGVKSEQDFAGSTLGRAKSLGDLTGYDPFTGLPTPKYDYQMNYLGPAALQRARTGQQRADVNSQNVQNQIGNRDARTVIATLNAELAARKAGGVLSQSEIDRIEDRFGIRVPATFDPGKQDIKLNKDGDYILINKVTGAVTQTNTKSYEPQKEAGKDRRADIIAGGQQQRTDLQKRETERREREEQNKNATDARKQALKEFPQPRGPFGTPPSQEEMNTWKEKVDARTEELTQGKVRPPNAPSRLGGDSIDRLNQSYKNSLPEGAKIVDTERSASTGKVRYKVQMPDGSIQYMYPKN